MHRGIGGGWALFLYICFPVNLTYPARIALYLTVFIGKNHKIINT